MGSFVARRAIRSLFSLLVASIIAFGLVHMTGGDPVTIMLGYSATPENIAAVRAKYGLDQPVVVQFVQWLARAVRGDLGESMRSAEAVTSLLGQRIGVTFRLAGAAFLLALSLAVPGGVTAATHLGKRVDRTIVSMTVMGISVPNFFTAIVLILVFVGWLGVAGLDGNWVIPIVSLALPYTALTTRMLRAEMAGSLRQDYIRTALSLGISRKSVIWKHALRNSLIPAVTVAAMQFGTMFGGTIVIENVFGVQGLGTLMLRSVVQRDIPVVQGVILVTALAFSLCNLIADILYALLDPRIRYES